MFSFMEITNKLLTVKKNIWDDWRLTGTIDYHYKWMAINCKCKYR